MQGEKDEEEDKIKDVPRQREEELSKDQGDGDNEFNTVSLDQQTEIPSWLEQQLKTKAPILLYPKYLLEAILPQAQDTREEEAQPVRS